MCEEATQEDYLDAKLIKITGFKNYVLMSSLVFQIYNCCHYCKYFDYSYEYSVFCVSSVLILQRNFCKTSEKLILFLLDSRDVNVVVMAAENNQR